MWQEIVVGLIVILAVGLIGRRFWKSYLSAGSDRIVCSCGCKACCQGSGELVDCTEQLPGWALKDRNSF
jgi:hypothetical protein